MGKKKSVVFIILITILLAALLFFSFIPFPVSAVSKFNSFVASSQLGMEFGGGVETIYYPEGVISQNQYNGLDSKQTQINSVNYDVQENYLPYKGVYIQKNYFQDENNTQNGLKPDFMDNFNKAFQIIQRRFERKELSNFSIFKQDDFTILVRVPHTNESDYEMFNLMKANGGIKLTDTQNTSHNYNVNDASMIRNASVFNAGDAGYGVRINLTSQGREHISNLTSGASTSSPKTIYLYIGKQEIFNVQVTEKITTGMLQISGRYSSKEAADTASVLINMATKEENLMRTPLYFDNIYTFNATMGNYSALVITIGLLLSLAAAIVYFFIRYKGLGFVYLLSSISFILSIILCTTFIPTLVISPGSFLAILMSGILLSVFTKFSFDKIKEEFRTGKTLSASIRNGFNRSIFLTAEVHGALFVFSTLFFALGTGILQSVGLLFMIGIGLSAAITLGLNRFYLYLTLPQAKNKIAYCNLRKEVKDLDEED